MVFNRQPRKRRILADNLVVVVKIAVADDIHIALAYVELRHFFQKRVAQRAVQPHVDDRLAEIFLNFRRVKAEGHVAIADEDNLRPINRLQARGFINQRGVIVVGILRRNDAENKPDDQAEHQRRLEQETNRFFHADRLP